MKVGYILRVWICFLWLAEARLIPNFWSENLDQQHPRDDATGAAGHHHRQHLPEPSSASNRQRKPSTETTHIKSSAKNDGDFTRALDGQEPTQPPQHYIPGLSIDPSLTSLFKATYARLMTLVTFKPPVGIVAVAVIYRLVGKGRLWKLYDIKDSDQPERRQTRTREGSHRSHVLDDADQLYLTQGGTLPIRKKLLLSVATSLLCSHPLVQRTAASSDGHTVRPALVLLETMIFCLKVSHHPGSPKVGYVRDLAEAFSRLQSISSDASILPDRIGQHEQLLSPADKLWLLELCQCTTDVCFTDGLLRVCRDRLLASSLRLARAQGYWKRRVKSLQGLPKLFPLDKLVEGDRMRLSLATAALQQELARLGQIATVLIETPADMEPNSLIQALRLSETERQEQKLNGTLQKSNRKPLHIPNIGSLTNKASQYYRDGTFSVRKMGNDEIRGRAALTCLLDKSTEQEAWMLQARSWNARARRVLFNVVQDTLRNSSPGSGFGTAEFEALRPQFLCAPPSQPKVTGVEPTLTKVVKYVDSVSSWRWSGEEKETRSTNAASSPPPKARLGGPVQTLTKVVKYVDSISSWRRIGEGKELRLGDTFLADWSRRLDILGIPSSLVVLWVALQVHNIVMPVWPRFRKDAIDIALKFKEIVDARLLVPLRDIADDILNKNPGMMAGFGLTDESSSLDRMLRDMGFGDGTEATRHEALLQATNEYEKDVQSGIVGMLVKGRLVTLLLLQMQQLKVGLLSALADIDVLMQGNRINFQVMAAIPAVLLVYVMIHFFMRRLYNIRAKDLRPMTAVHADMTNYLNNMERIILSTAEPSSESYPATKSLISAPPFLSLLSYADLGNWMLMMHRYLLLLDYSSPPYPQMSCNDIHLTLQSFGGRNGVLSVSGSARNLDVIHRVQQKHDGLTKFL